MNNDDWTRPPADPVEAWREACGYWRMRANFALQHLGQISLADSLRVQQLAAEIEECRVQFVFSQSQLSAAMTAFSLGSRVLVGRQLLSELGGASPGVRLPKPMGALGDASVRDEIHSELKGPILDVLGGFEQVARLALAGNNIDALSAIQSAVAEPEKINHALSKIAVAGSAKLVADRRRLKGTASGIKSGLVREKKKNARLLEVMDMLRKGISSKEIRKKVSGSDYKLAIGEVTRVIADCEGSPEVVSKQTGYSIRLVRKIQGTPRK